MRQPARPRQRPARSAAGALPALALALAALAIPAAGRAQSTYIAFGDSITWGVGDTVQDGTGGYPARLQKLLRAAGVDVVVENDGLPGEDTTQALTRIDQVLATPSGSGADVLLLMEGSNDISRQISLETTLFDLSEIARKAELKGLSVVHATCIPRLPDAPVDSANVLNLRLAESIRDLAGNRQRDLADPFEVFSELPDLFDTYYSPVRPDPVGHPNSKGYDVMGQHFFDVLRGNDKVAPVPGLTTPAWGDESVGAQAPISVDVWDLGAGIDLANTTLLVNGTATGATPTGDSRHAQLVYTPVTPLAGVVHVTLRAKDLATPPNAHDIEVVRYAVAGTVFLAGDINRDGRVDGNDLVLLARSFGLRSSQRGYSAAADINGDGIVDGVDLAQLAANFGKSSF